MNRYLLHISFAVALFFLLLTGENALLHQKETYSKEVTSSSVTEFLIAQHQLKATTSVEKSKLYEVDYPMPLYGITFGIQSLNHWQYLQSFSKELLRKNFMMDKRKSISQLLYPYHFFW